MATTDLDRALAAAADDSDAESDHFAPFTPGDEKAPGTPVFDPDGVVEEAHQPQIIDPFGYDDDVPPAPETPRAPGTPVSELLDANGDILGSDSAGHARRRKPRHADAGTQANENELDWNAFDLTSIGQLLRSHNTNVVRRTLRALHVRFSHMLHQTY